MGKERKIQTKVLESHGWMLKTFHKVWSVVRDKNIGDFLWFHNDRMLRHKISNHTLKKKALSRKRTINSFQYSLEQSLSAGTGISRKRTINRPFITPRRLLGYFHLAWLHGSFQLTVVLPQRFPCTQTGSFLVYSRLHIHFHTVVIKRTTLHSEQQW